MRTLTYCSLSVLSLLCLPLAAQVNPSQPKKVKIGETVFEIQSPVRISSDPEWNTYSLPTDSVEKVSYVEKKSTHKKHFIGRSFSQLYAGYGVPVRTGNEPTLSIFYPNSFSLYVGQRFFYRPVRHYAIGTFWQYTCYSYRINNKTGADIFGFNPPSPLTREYFRTDNLGTGLINRFYLFKISPHRRLVLDLGAYGDYAYSKRYKVKYNIDGVKGKEKYRDSNKFNMFEAGLHAGIRVGCFSLYGRYRLTDFFNDQEIAVAEPPRLTIGIELQFSLTGGYYY